MNKSIVIIGFVWPEPETTAAGTRILQLIEIFQKQDFKITFCSTALKTKNSYPLEKLGIETISITLNNRNFDDFIKKTNPTMVLFDRFLTEEQFGWRIAEICPNAIRILDTEDLHFLRKTRKQNKVNESLKLEDFNNDITKREMASIYRCDLSLIISKFELQLLTNLFKIDPEILLYIPFIFDALSANTINLQPTFDQRQDFMTIGNFKHEPNWNAVLHLKTTIWPLLKKEIPDAKLHVFGAYAPDKAKQLHNEKEGFLIEGWVENKQKAFENARVCLAPLQFGAGLKGKLIDSMLFGTPSVTTTIGAEGMHDSIPWNGFIADDPKEFVSNSVALYSSKEIWNQSQKNGYTIINQCYTKEVFETLFFDKLYKIEENLEKHRAKNFIGSMLLHHSLKSTKFLSKWIEEKNRNNQNL